METNIEHKRTRERAYYWNNIDTQREKKRIVRAKRVAQNHEAMLRYSREYYASHKEQYKKHGDAWRTAHPERVKELRLKNKGPIQMFRSAKSRAKKNKLPFNLELSDITIPEVCPVLGIRLVANTKRGNLPTSPTLDRFIPELGYVKGNVAVISHRANTLKNDATVGEIEKVVAWMKAQLCPR